MTYQQALNRQTHYRERKDNYVQKIERLPDGYYVLTTYGGEEYRMGVEWNPRQPVEVRL